MIIEFNKTANIFGVMGGNPYLKNLSDWPLNEKGQRMIHLFTLFSIIYAGGQLMRDTASAFTSTTKPMKEDS